MHIKFTGDGTAEIVGIPARNLSELDWNELTPAQQAHALASGLYEHAVKATPVTSKKSTPDTGKDAN